MAFLKKFLMLKIYLPKLMMKNLKKNLKVKKINLGNHGYRTVLNT